MNRRLWWIGVTGAVASLCFSASVLFARQGVVKTRDGRTIEGDIEEKPDQVTISIRGIRTNIPRDQVMGQVEYFDNVEARYQDKVSKLPKNATAADRLALARWLFDVKQYDLALKEIEEARKHDPNSAEAATLEQTVISQRRIERAAAANGPAGTRARPPMNTTGTPRPPADTGTPPRTDAAADDAAAADKGKGHYLSPEQVNVIRQTEWRENDTIAPRASVPADVRKRYADMKAFSQADFAARPANEQAYIILSDPDAPEDMRRQIKLTSDVQALTEYRRTIQPLILNNCATVGCHGGGKAGKFVLYPNNPDRDEVAYTNFYILQKYVQQVNGQSYGMMDRTYPDRSLLLQYALHPDASELDHPQVKGQTLRPLAVSKQAPAYQTIANWMSGLRAGEPNYGFKFELPGGAQSKDGAPKPAAGKAPAPAAPATPAPAAATPKPNAPKPAAQPAAPRPATPTPARPPVENK